MKKFFALFAATFTMLIFGICAGIGLALKF